jgi:NADH-quinone oxidoreductase subunit N
MNDLNIFAASPEIILLSAACVIMLVDLWLSEQARHISFSLTQLSLIVVCALCLAKVGTPETVAYAGHYLDDNMSRMLKAASCAGLGALLYYARDYLIARGLYKGEVFTLMLFSLLGMMVMISGGNLLSLYIGLELQALCLYALVALDRDSVPASEAAMKYFVLGALASGLLLYGLSMVYGATGQLDIAQIYSAVAKGKANKTLLVLGAIFIVSGIAFKLGAVPYHMWVPDVYQGATTPVTLFIASIPKLAAFAFVVRLLPQALDFLKHEWSIMLTFLSVLSMILGNLVAIKQNNLKRLLAYSAIANMGFMLLGLIAATPAGYASSMFYTLAYVLTTLAGFGAVLLLTHARFEHDSLDDLNGLAHRSAWMAFVLLVVFFSLAGIPGTIGFWAKFSVIMEVIKSGHIVLAVIAVTASLFGAYYYLMLVRRMWFQESTHEHAVVHTDVSGLLSLNTLAILLLGVLPGWLLGLCAQAFQLSSK